MTADNGRRSLDELLASQFAHRRILITGHSGFVGSWLSTWLASAGCEILGISLPMERERTPSDLAPGEAVREAWGDIRHLTELKTLFAEFAPEIVFHLAAQALVLPSYNDPVATFETNTLGTAYVLEAIRSSPSVRASLVVTSDKCYATREGPHTEDDPLGGDDPYSASKGAAEIIANAYNKAFLRAQNVAVATARAGNIVGGGDAAPYRVIPDCVRAIRAGEPVELRHPEAVRPWQHVLDAVAGYIRLTAGLLESPSRFEGSWNFGPTANEAVSVRELVKRFLAGWRERGSTVAEPIYRRGPNREERSFLVLDSTKSRANLGWHPLLPIEETVNWSVDWYYQVEVDGVTSATFTSNQINKYLQLDHSGQSGRGTFGTGK